MAVGLKNRVSQGLAFSTIVLAVIGIFVMVLIILFVSGNFRSTSRTTQDLTVGGSCNSYGGVCIEDEEAERLRAEEGKIVTKLSSVQDCKNTGRTGPLRAPGGAFSPPTSPSAGSEINCYIIS